MMTSKYVQVERTFETDDAAKPFRNAFLNARGLAAKGVKCVTTHHEGKGRRVVVEYDPKRYDGGIGGKYDA